MGKNKDKKKGKHGEERRHHKQAFTQTFDGVPPQVAGIAAAALKQVNTPAFQHLIAGALGAAGKAMEDMAQRSAATQASGQATGPTPTVPPVPPTPPVPPVPPEPPFPPEPQAAYAPRFETPQINLPPEAAEAIERVAHQAAQAIEGAAQHASRAIETAAAAFERWAEKQARPKSEG